MSPLSPLSTLSMDSEDGTDDGPKQTFEVTMVKGVTGLGFLIEGGKGSPRGDLPLSIRRIFKGKVSDEKNKLNTISEIAHS